MYIYIYIYIYIYFVYIKLVNKYDATQKEQLHKEARGRYQSLSEEEKEKKVEYMRNYYLAHKKQILSCSS